MTRAQMLAMIGRRLNKNATLDASTQSRLLDSLNDRHRRLLSLPGLQHLRQITATLASVADQSLYGLANVAKVDRIVDLTNRRPLLPMTMAQYRSLQPDASTTTGTPTHWVWDGYGPVAVQPSDASRLFWKSTSASDTQNGFIEGVITGGYPLIKTKALTGVTAVDVDTAVTTWIRVDKAYLTSVAVGVVTLHEDSGSGTELARIGIGQTEQRYYQIRLWPTPSAVNSFLLDETREITDFAQDTDEPLLPIDFHDLLVLGAVMDEYQHLDDTRYVVAASEYAQRVGQFQYWQHEPASGSTSTHMQRPSQLGSWFPAGS